MTGAHRLERAGNLGGLGRSGKEGGREDVNTLGRSWRGPERLERRIAEERREGEMLEGATRRSR